MKNLIKAAFLVVFISACAGPARYAYTKEGASEHQRTDAVSECRYQIKVNKTPATEEAELLKLCMQGKGYRLRRID